MILTTISLDEIKHSSSSTFYRLLSPYYKPVYEPDDRIVIENFSEISDDFLVHVSNCIEILDISSFFITVRTDQPRTQQFFQDLKEPIRVEFGPGMPAPTVGNTQPIFNNDGKMCPHAWTGMHIHTDGKVKVCCVQSGFIKDDQGQSFDIKQHDFDEIINSASMIEMRQQFRSGVTPSACHRCEHYEKNDGVSKRSLSKFKLSNLFYEIDWEDDIVDKDKNLYIGGHLGNTCNLKCRICNERCSSQIAVEKIRLKQTVNIDGVAIKEDMVSRNWKLSNPTFWEKLRKLGSRARNFEFLGGEPLLLQDNLDFMQHLVDSGQSENCIFEFVTNGTQYPKIFDRANKFHRLTISISIDDIGPRFEYQRKNSDWETVRENIAKFVATRDANKNKMEIGVSITVNIQNILYLPELILWLKAQKVDHYFINYLEDPKYLSIKHLTPQAKLLVLDRLQNCDLPAQDKEKLAPVITMITKAGHSDGADFCRYMRDLDAVRNENFAEHHKEIAEAMGYMLQ